MKFHPRWCNWVMITTFDTNIKINFEFVNEFDLLKKTLKTSLIITALTFDKRHNVLTFYALGSAISKSAFYSQNRVSRSYHARHLLQCC